MNGVTGRMGTNQHLIRSICAIRDQGACKSLPTRSSRSIRSLPDETRTSSVPWPTGPGRTLDHEPDEALADPGNQIFFVPVPPFIGPGLWRWRPKQAKRFTVKNQPRSRPGRPFDLPSYARTRE